MRAPDSKRIIDDGAGLVKAFVDVDGPVVAVAVEAPDVLVPKRATAEGGQKKGGDCQTADAARKIGPAAKHDSGPP